jgi:CRISPR type I-E-associated protein CasB/Cse2
VTETNSAEPAAPPRESPHPALEWWRRLSDPRRGDPGTLARLRRSRSTLEAMQVPDALELARRLGAMPRDGQAPDWKVRAALDLARVLAHVREHDPAQHPMRAAGWKHFAGRQRESDAGKDRPVLSEARFRRLLLTGGGEEKVSAFTRLIALLGGTVKVDDLARDFMRWNDPEHGDRVRERWAFLYYAAGTAAPPLPAETDTPTEDQDA